MNNVIVIDESNSALKIHVIEQIKSHMSVKFPDVTHVTVESYNTREGNTVRLRESFTHNVCGVFNLFTGSIYSS